MKNIILLSNHIYSVSEITKKLCANTFRKQGLTVKTYAILVCIVEGIGTTTDIANFIQGSPASVTQKTKILENKGLIMRKFDKKDKRIWHFSLTKKGQRVLERILPDYEKVITEIFKSFSKAEISQTLKFFKTLKIRLLEKLEINNK